MLGAAKAAKALFTVAVSVNALPPKIMAEWSVSTTMKPLSASEESPKLLRSAGLQANMALLVTEILAHILLPSQYTSLMAGSVANQNSQSDVHFLKLCGQLQWEIMKRSGINYLKLEAM